jgi:predicted LPLAT superfamily acyltransferase
MYAGKTFTINIEGYEHFLKLAHQPKAFIQMSSHVGNYEIAGYSLTADSKRFNALVYGGEKAEVMAYREKAFGNKNVKMIPVATEGSHSEEIIRAFDNGEIVSAFADRFMSDNKLIISTIHGHKVKLAKGPFSMAVNRGLTVFMANALKERDGSYSAYFTPLHYDNTLPTKQQRQQLADAYCAEIERLLAKYPLQWFNYTDMWAED